MSDIQDNTAATTASGVPAGFTPAADPTLPPGEGEPQTSPGMNWFVLRVASNKESSVQRTLVRKVKIENYQHLINRVLVPTEITGAETNKWYVAFDEELEAAAMSLYIVYQHIEGDLDLVDSALNPVNAPIDGFDVLYTGGRIYF